MPSSSEAFSTPGGTSAFVPCRPAMSMMRMRRAAVCSKAYSRSRCAGFARPMPAARNRPRAVNGAMCGSTRSPYGGFFIIELSRRPAAKRAARSSASNAIEEPGAVLEDCARSRRAGCALRFGCRSQANAYRVADFLTVRTSFGWARSFRRAGRYAHTCCFALPESFRAACGPAPARCLSRRRVGSDPGGATGVDVMLRRGRRCAIRPAASLRCCNGHARFTRVRCDMLTSRMTRDYRRPKHAVRTFCAIQEKIASNATRISCRKVGFATD